MTADVRRQRGCAANAPRCRLSDARSLVTVQLSVSLTSHRWIMFVLALDMRWTRPSVLRDQPPDVSNDGGKTMIWNCRRNPDSEYAATVHETAVSDVLTTFITSWSVSVVGTRFVTAWSIISTIHRLERRQRAIGAANHHNRRSRLSLRTILARRPFKPDDVGRGRRDPLPWLCCLLAVAYYHFPVAIDDIRAGSTTMARRPRTNQCRMTWQACVARAPCASADQVLKARRSVHRLIST